MQMLGIFLMFGSQNETKPDKYKNAYPKVSKQYINMRYKKKNQRKIHI